MQVRWRNIFVSIQTADPREELVFRASHCLTPANFSAIQSDVISNRQEGTGQWLLDSTEYKTWRDAARPTLFCPGIPGAGKTMMSSIVINELQKDLGNDNQVGLAYLFCDFKRQSEQTPTDLFAGLLKQLVENQPVLPGVLETLYEYHSRRKTRPTFHELSHILSCTGSSTRWMNVQPVIALETACCVRSSGCRNREASVFLLPHVSFLKYNACLEASCRWKFGLVTTT